MYISGDMGIDCSIVIFILVMYKIGVFSGVKDPEEKPFPGGTLFYREYVGLSSGFRSEFNKVDKEMKAYVKSLGREIVYPLAGIYYDDPKDLVDQTKFRGSVGIFVSHTNAPLVAHFTSLGYLVKQLPARAACVTTSWTGMLTKSWLTATIGAFKAYPALYDYLDEHREKLLPRLQKEKGKSVMMEIYEHGEIQYYMPIEKLSDFNLVNEVRQGVPELLSAKKDN